MEISDTKIAITAVIIIITVPTAAAYLSGVVSETLALGLASAGIGAIAYSNGAFSSIIQLKCNIATGKHVSVGISNKLGMANRVINESDLYKKKVNTADDTASISTNVDTDKWTLDCGTINAGDDVSVWYRSNRNVVSSCVAKYVGVNPCIQTI